MISLEKIQEAASMVEHDGTDCYFSVKTLYGEEIALILMVAHLRRQLGAGKSYPSGKEIDDKVVKMLKENGIIK